MVRNKLPDRREAATRKVPYEQANGRSVTLLVTIGFHPETKRVSEIFCADFKAGSEFHAIIMDTCILLSRLFQHGDIPEEIANSVGHPLIKTLAMAAAEEDKQR